MPTLRDKMNCPHCQKTIPENFWSEWCPHSGKDLPATGPRPRKNNWLLPLGLLFAPALLTMLVATFKSSDATTLCVLLGSPIAGINAAIILARNNFRSETSTIFLTLFYAVIFSAFCLISSFVGCNLAGNGGVRIGG